MAATPSSGPSTPTPSPTSSEQGPRRSRRLRRAWASRRPAGASCLLTLCAQPCKATVRRSWTRPSTTLPAPHPTPPHRRGVSALFIGWGTSPVLAMIAASILFFLVRTFVMHSSNPFERALWVFPMAMWLTIFTVVFTIIQASIMLCCSRQLHGGEQCGDQPAGRPACLPAKSLDGTVQTPPCLGEWPDRVRLLNRACPFAVLPLCCRLATRTRPGPRCPTARPAGSPWWWQSASPVRQLAGSRGSPWLGLAGGHVRPSAHCGGWCVLLTEGRPASAAPPPVAQP